MRQTTEERIPVIETRGDKSMVEQGSTVWSERRTKMGNITKMKI